MEIAAQALAGLSPSARAPHKLHRERVRTDDSHIADCTARLDELCARVPIGEADARAARDGIASAMPRAVVTRGHVQHSGWAAAAVWTAAVANQSSLELATLVNGGGGGASLCELFVSPGYVNEWAQLALLPEVHPVWQALARVKKQHVSLQAMRVKWAQLLAADPVCKVPPPRRVFSRQMESVGWCVYVHVSRRIAAQGLSEQPDMLRCYAQLVGVLHVLLDALSSAGGVDAEQKRALLERAYAHREVQAEQIDSATDAVRVECRRLFRQLPNGGDSCLLSETWLAGNLQALLRLALEPQEHETPQLDIDPRWYATDELVVSVLGDHILKRDIDDAGRNSAGSGSEDESNQPTAAGSPSAAAQRLCAASGAAPMSPEQKEKLDSTLAAETLAILGVFDRQNVPAAPPVLPKRPPGTPIGAAIRDSQWMTQLTTLVPDNVAEMVQLAQICGICRCQMVSLTSRVDQMAAAVVRAAVVPGAATQQLPVAAKLYLSSLEMLLLPEKTRLSEADFVAKVGKILGNTQFHRALYAIACELVFNQNGGTSHLLPFAGFLQAVEASPFEVSKVLANLITLYSSGSGGIMTAAPLSVVYHLRQCEDQLLESLAWRADSSIFELLAPSGEASVSSTASVADSAAEASGSSVARAGVEQVMLGPGSSHALRVFFAHLLLLAEVRLKKLLQSLHAIALLDKCWSVLTHIFAEKRTLMRNRHLDQLLMATIYSVAKVLHINGKQLVRDVTFRSIIKQYTETFGSERGHVYRSVLLRADPKGAPTYGDVIKFYNDVYVPELKDYVLSLGESGPGISSDQQHPADSGGAPALSVAHLNTSILNSPMRAVNGVSYSPATAAGGVGVLSPSRPGIEMTPRTQALYHFGGASPAQTTTTKPPKQQLKKRPLAAPLNFDEPDADGEGPLQKRMKQIAGPLGFAMGVSSSSSSSSPS
jgi:hypothetical protein